MSSIETYNIYEQFIFSSSYSFEFNRGDIRYYRLYWSRIHSHHCIVFLSTINMYFMCHTVEYKILWLKRFLNKVIHFFFSG